MTYRQLGTLKFIQTHEVGIDYVRKLNLTTFGSLFQRGWIKAIAGRIELTDLGYEEYERYSRPGVVLRKHEGEISDRVKSMLHLRRNGK